MKKILFILLLLTVAPGFAQETFRLETGDLLFQVNGRSAYTDAIKNVTSGIGQLEFSHVGVAYVENGETYVLEAVPYGVVKSKLDKFFRNSQLIDGKPVVVVGRLKPRLQKNIPAAIERIKKLLGKRPQFVRGIWVKSNIGGEKGTQLIYRKLTNRRSYRWKRIDKALVSPVADLHFRDLLGSAHALLQQIFHVAALSQATTPPAPDYGRTLRRGSSVRSPEYSYRRQGIPPP